jgi:ubiquinone/menaquinone biosynthesis C-methylase UbiE
VDGKRGGSFFSGAKVKQVVVSDSILDFYAQNHASFLHGHGQLATQKMLAQLQLQGQEKVLEIGCGTGASLVLLKSVYPNLRIAGGDISPMMYHKARQRIAFAGLKDAIEVYRFEHSAPLPLEDESYDVVWIESVLAILDSPLLHQMLININRILKPGGKLVFNESLWLSPVPQKEIDNINQQCLKHFGIIQANGEFPTADDWHTLLEQHSFEISLKATFETLTTTTSLPNTFSYRRSQLFNQLGRVRAQLSSKQRNYRKKLRQLEGQIMGTPTQKLKAYLFIAEKGG